MSVCLFVTMLTVTLFVHSSKIRYHRLHHDEFLDFDSQISLTRLCQEIWRYLPNTW